MLPAMMTPPSVNKLPGLRNRNLSSASIVRRPLFQETEDLGQNAQVTKVLPITLVQLSALHTDGTPLEEPASTGSPTATLHPSASADKRCRSPSVKSAANALAKKGKN